MEMVIRNDEHFRKLIICCGCLPPLPDATVNKDVTIQEYYYNEGAIDAGWLRMLVPEYASTVKWYCPDCAKKIVKQYIKQFDA